MRITFSRSGGVPVLTCMRADGSVTYQKSPHGAFFGPHDLLHYAVETVLEQRESFFGLIARGRSIQWFSEKGVAAQLSVEATHTELMVNQLMTELNVGEASDADEFNRVLAVSCAAAKRGPLPPPARVTDAQLAQIRERFSALLHRYRSLADGERLELDFPD